MPAAMSRVFVPLLGLAATDKSAVAAAAPHPRALKQFDFFQNFCQQEGSTFLQCFSRLDDPVACSDCHLSFIGKDTAMLGLSCHAQCDASDESGTACNSLGINAVHCVNDKIWRYHCREQFNDLRNCNVGDCEAESAAFEQCLLDGTKVLRGQNLTECEGVAEAFEICMADSSLSDIAKESCKLCHSDVGFGFNDNSCSCSPCDTEGSLMASCVRDEVKCPSQARNDIGCIEHQFFCMPSECDADEEKSSGFASDNSQGNIDWGNYNYSADPCATTGDIDGLPCIDWTPMRDHIKKAKEVAASIREKRGNSGAYSYTTSLPSSLLVVIAVFVLR